MIRLFVGLGNPGAAYEDTRHNAGFWWIDALAAQLGLSLRADKAWQGLAARGTHEGQPIWLLQPQTFMNLSGNSVAPLARFYKVPPQRILVVHDELDIAPGQAKLKLGGSSTHNGLRDITAQLGTPDYWRLRIGVGHPGVKSEVADWVLRKPPADQRDAIHDTVARTLKALPELLSGDMERATQIVHTSKPPRPKPARPAGDADGPSKLT